MKGPVRRAIDSGKYNLSIAWDNLDLEDRNTLLSWVRTYSSYGKDAHMGMLPLLSVKTIFMVLDRAATAGVYYGLIGGPSNINNPLMVRIRAIIRLQIKGDLRLQKYLAKMRAKERHTA